MALSRGCDGTQRRNGPLTDYNILRKRKIGVNELFYALGIQYH